ncbi:MAG: GtrA family protein [Spirochaetes bacterium]|nr:GtrA family protein [Spirochaetota bacterium]
MNVWRIKRSVGRDTGVDQFIKFAVTGGLGTLTNLIIFFFCVDIFGLPVIQISTICFLIAVTQNYIINHKWSFKRDTAEKTLSPKKWIEFIAISLLGLAVNLLVLKALLSNFEFPYKVIAQAGGIAAGMTVNFIMAKWYVFRRV